MKQETIVKILLENKGKSKKINTQSAQRVHNRFGEMRDLAIFRGDTRDASWKQARDAGILITRGYGISYIYGDGGRAS